MEGTASSPLQVLHKITLLLLVAMVSNLLLKATDSSRVNSKVNTMASNKAMVSNNSTVSSKVMVSKAMLSKVEQLRLLIPLILNLGPPGGVDERLMSWFKSVDADGSGQLSADELQRALVNGDWSPFNIETVRLMVNMFDSDNSGTINYNEFQGLWKYIEDWKRCFQAFDADNSGSINESEMSNALRSFGFNVSPRFVQTLIQKFDRYGHGAKTKGKGDVSFDNFVQACVTVKTLTDSFRQFDTDADGWIQINYEQFLELVARQRS
ncbi:hypothetical protein BY458DRAFT_515108 [Sporodiniella umbellata]|nr:hypothetical protein BY458DRAFT_515108 [Sporodiniella umbellata]